MMIEKNNLWNEKVGLSKETPTITAYFPSEKKSDSAIVIFPGGAYAARANHEGEEYAKFLTENGYIAFVVDYRVSPHRFPLPLLDARRAIRFVRFYSPKYGIDKNKIGVMGSSAGGHLAALSSTYFNPIEFEGVDEIDKEDFIPNFQILCYPVISLFGNGLTHINSVKNLLGDMALEKCEELSPNLMANEKTPPAFIWHTFADGVVNVKNSLFYTSKLKDLDIKAELHIFPDGEHGMGLSKGESKERIYVSQWRTLFLKWLEYMEI
jgi:acetyl esterase/lipase